MTVTCDVDFNYKSISDIKKGVYKFPKVIDEFFDNENLDIFK